MFEPMPMIAHVTRDRDVITTTIKMTTWSTMDDGIGRGNVNSSWVNTSF
jgi:hypothetical protein